jgi:RND family efflux transporter MFP subunit
MKGRLWLLALASACATGCGWIGELWHEHEHGDAHGHDHGHDHGGGHEDEAELPTVAITKWTDRYELFVELPWPLAGKPVPYHAHVTRLDDFHAVTEGTFHVRFRGPAGIAAEARIDGVKRSGIFVPEGPAPAAGSYSLEMTYEHAGVTDTWDCGTIQVTDAPPPPEAEAPSSAITFLKESQWKIAFATAWAEERSIAREIELAATVEPAGTDRLTIAAPTSGRFFHDPKASLAEGRRVEAGDVLGAIAPAIAGDDYSRLLLSADEARLEHERLERELARIRPLVAEGLLPERRRVDLEAELELASARRRGTRERVARVAAPGGAGGLAIRSTLAGVIAQVLVPNGEAVEVGAPLVRVGGNQDFWVRAQFLAKPPSAYLGAAPSAVRLPSGALVDLRARGARLLSSAPTLDPSSRVATWIAEVPAAGGAAPVDERDLRPGTSVVLVVRVGEPRPALVVPRGAVVEIDTHAFVFVQIDGEHFEKRRVALGDTDGGLVEITAGVAKGERVVTRGGFDVHLASLMGTVESHRH